MTSSDERAAGSPRLAASTSRLTFRRISGIFASRSCTISSASPRQSSCRVQSFTIRQV